VLVERERREHPAAGRLRRSDWLGSLAPRLRSELDSAAHLELGEATEIPELLPVLLSVPSPRAVRDCLGSSGYSEAEIEQAAVLADSRWPGRLCGGWRDERGRIKTLWARSLDSPDGGARYLYLRGTSRHEQVA
jgi:hypothetical protein